MAQQFQVKITGAKEVQDKLKRLGSSLYDFSVSMRAIGQDLGEYFANQAYASQGGVFGEPWAPLSPKYAEWKAEHFPGRPPLVLSGDMQRSYYAETGPQSVFISNKAEYFKYHQSTDARSKMPRRATMGLNDPLRRVIVDIMQREVTQKIRNA